MSQRLRDSLYGLLFLAAVLGGIFVMTLLPMIGGISPYLQGALILTVYACLLTWGFLRHEGVQLGDLGLFWRQRWLTNALLGTAAGLLMLLLMLGVLLWFAGVTVATSESQTWAVLLMASVPVVFFLALMEEVMFRGYLLFKLRQAWGIRAAVYFTAIVFGLYHGLVVESLIGPGVWGLVYAWLALVSKGLVLPTMFHFGLNWGQTLFGMKTKYTEGMFVLNLDPNHAGMAPDQVGLIMQIVIALVAVVLIEWHIRSNKK